MFEFLQKKINETISISDEEFEYAKTLFIPKKLRKKRFLLHDGDPCIYTTFVEKGLLRSFRIDDKDSSTSEYNIEALEDSELLLITKPSWDKLLHEVPAFEHYFRILIQNNLIATQRRLMGTMSSTAEERYNKLLQEFPDIAQRVPQHMIASYIGVTRETLSRLRSQLASGS